MADDVNWDICFLCQDSISLFTLVHEIFLLLFFIYIRIEEQFDTSPTVFTNKYYFTYNISHKLLRPSQFLEKCMEMLEWSTLQR